MKNPDGSSILSVTGNEMSVSAQSIDLQATSSTITLTAATQVAISAVNINFLGGVVRVDSHDLAVTATTNAVEYDIFRVRASSEQVEVKNTLKFNNDVAAISHTMTGQSVNTGLTISSRKLVLNSADQVSFAGTGNVVFSSSGEVVLSTSGNRPTSTACAQGTLRYDATYLYICVAANSWMQVQLNATTI